MGLAERLLRRITGRPRVAPDHGLIGRIERDLDAERRAEEQAEQHRAAVEACAREGHLQPAGEACEITSWGSATPIRLLPGCPRCGTPAENISVEELDAAIRLQQAGLA